MQGLRFRVQGLRFRVQGLGFIVASQGTCSDIWGQPEGRKSFLKNLQAVQIMRDHRNAIQSVGVMR